MSDWYKKQILNIKMQKQKEMDSFIDWAFEQAITGKMGTKQDDGSIAVQGTIDKVEYKCVFWCKDGEIHHKVMKI